MKVLITGGAGFIGAHIVEHLLKNTDWHIVIFDKLTYAANGLDRLRDVKASYSNEYGNRVAVYALDVARPISVGVMKEIGAVDYILHLAAETHVDNSIKRPWDFVESNVVGTYQMLEFARQVCGLKRFVYFSTDEVFGPAPDGVFFAENARYNSTNPYSATKAAGEELAWAWANTYKLPMIVTHAMNNFGERQHPEKFIPLVVRKILANETITIHADATKTRAGSRHYIHARNTADALLFLLQNEDRIGSKEKFNIVGEAEVNNLQLVYLIRKLLSNVLVRDFEVRTEMVDFHGSRPGHDLRYALSGKRLETLGWGPPKTFAESLEKTIQWMMRPENLKWMFLKDTVLV